MITLYQMPISHYCEKVRWMLDYKRLPYKKKNLLPGLHIKPMLKLTEQSSVPVLVDNKKVVFNSPNILAYLDAEYPRFPLDTQNEECDQGSVLAINEWESLADDVVGVHVRKICYATILDHPDIIIPIFAQGGPWYGRFVMKKIFPQVRYKMRKYLKLDPEEIKISVHELNLVKEKVLKRVKDHEYLVGNSFTRADLSVAALFAPFFCPEKYGLEWPQHYPEPLQSIIDDYSDIGVWVQKMYNKHR